MLVIIDTLANSIEGQDENSSAALGLYWAMLRMIRLEVKAATLTIAHVGKDKTKGVRGWSGSIGTVDRVLFTDGDRDRKVGKITHEMAKDTPDYPPQFYKLVDCGKSKIVKPIAAAEYEANKKPTAAEPSKWSAYRRQIAEILTKYKLYNNIDDCWGRDVLARRLAGVPPVNDGSVDYKAEKRDYENRVGKIKDDLKEGCRSRNGKPAPLAGLFSVEYVDGMSKPLIKFWMPEPDHLLDDLEAANDDSTELDKTA